MLKSFRSFVRSFVACCERVAGERLRGEMGGDVVGGDEAAFRVVHESTISACSAQNRSVVIGSHHNAARRRRPRDTRRTISFVRSFVRPQTSGVSSCLYHGDLRCGWLKEGGTSVHE